MAPQGSENGSAPIRVAAQPVSWGVWEADSPVPPTAVLDDIAACGYAGTELGPPGFFGEAPELRQALEQRNLELVASFVDVPLTDEERQDESLQRVAQAARLLRDAAPEDSRPVLLLSDSFDHPLRVKYAGRIMDHPDAWLPASAWATVGDTVNRAAAACVEEGVQVAFHYHGGSFIETRQEIDLLLDHIDTETTGLCIDTGHSVFAGHDPLDLLRDYGSLVRLVHLKDVDPRVLEAMHSEGFGIDEAWRRGVFCELGTGNVNLDGFLALLREASYEGWIVMEQDRVLGPDNSLDDAHAAALHNRAFLRDRGL